MLNNLTLSHPARPTPEHTPQLRQLIKLFNA